jgi:hypothetical protein
VAGPVAHVRDGVARLMLACHNADCRGVAKLIVRLGLRDSNGHPVDTALIGRATFAIPAETSVRLFVELNRVGRSLMRRAKQSGRYANLAGPGVRGRTILLKRVRAFPPV